jgi:hypothetical protein
MDLPAVRVQVGRKGLASEVLAGFEYDVFCSHGEAGFWKLNLRLCINRFVLFILQNVCRISLFQFVMFPFLWVPVPELVEIVVSKEPRIAVSCF